MPTSLRTLSTTSAVLTLLLAGRAECATLFVDASAAPSGDGASWNTAFRYLGQAIDAAGLPGSGVTEIRVAHGTYFPDQSVASPEGTGDRNATFPLLSDVAIRGGYGGVSARNPDARNLVAYPAVLSGDLPEDDRPNWVNHANNSFHVLSALGSGTGAVLDGFVVRGGYAGFPSNGAGGGITIVNASPTLVDCTFDECFGSLGGALYCDGGDPAITGCSFTGNYAWGGRGGAMYVGTPSTPVLNDCLFSANKAYGAGGPGDGGAVFLETSCPATFDHCVFLNNTSTTGGVPYPTGGAVSALSDNLTFNGCRFLHNTSPLGAGGAIWTASDHSVHSSCEFSGNSATVGGAVSVFFAADVSFLNCTIVGNAAGDGGGLSITYSSVAAITNCIFWSNTANAASPYKAAIHKDDTSQGNVSWTCIQQMWVPEPGEDPLDPANFPGCTDANPLFVDADGADNQYGTIDDDLRLTAGSPLIDSANNSAVPWITTTDVAGRPRFMDAPATPDSGSGTAPIVDMGANEFGVPPMLGDLNGDGAVNGADLAVLLGAWGTSTPAADLNHDGIVNGADLAILLGAWS